MFAVGSVASDSDVQARSRIVRIPHTRRRVGDRCRSPAVGLAALLTHPERVMSLPQRRLPGTTYMVTRRCSERRFFLRPEAIVTQVFKFVLAYAAAKTGMQVHEVIVLSNHFHMVITDPHARLELFMNRLNSLTARALNCFRRRGENFWSPDSYNAVELIGEEAVWEKLTYVAVNAVRAGLVRDPLDWPGFRTTPEDMLGNRVSALRPGEFFSEEMPEKTELRLCPPPALAHLEPADIEAELKRRIEAEASKIRRARKKSKLGWMGRRKILAQRVDESPGGTFPTRRTKPTISCREPGRFKRVERG